MKRSDSFPFVVNMEIDKTTEARKQAVRTETTETMKKLEEELKKPEPVGAGCLGCFGGLIIGLVISIPVWVARGEFLPGLYSWIAIIILFGIIGMVLGGNRKSKYHTEMDEIKKKIASTERSQYDRINNILSDARYQKERYLETFDNDVKELSDQFATSETAKEVVNWMTEGFCKTINNADRRSHIEKVNIPFEFKVYTDRITCNLGTYDFELKRCKKLDGASAQAALAKVIATALQLNIVMKYPKDISGTDISVLISYEYCEKYPAVTVTYSAANGKFKSAREW